MSEHLSNTGSIESILEMNIFQVHGLWFTIRDAIQSMLYLSDTMAEYCVDVPTCNAYAITFVPEDGIMVGVPVAYNREFYCTVTSKGALHTERMKELDKFPSTNEYQYTDDGSITIVMTRGFVIDNFNIPEEGGLHDFSTDEMSTSIILKVQDLESLSDINPNMEI